MSPKTARNLSIVALVTLYQPCRNLLALWDLFSRLYFHTMAPPMRLLHAIGLRYGPAAYLWFGFLICLILPLALSILLYRYLLHRDFAQVCADCAARKIRLTVLFILFALFSVFLFHATTAPFPVDLHRSLETIGTLGSIDDPAL